MDLDTPVDVVATREILAAHQLEGNYLFFAARRIIPLKGLHTLLAALKQMQYTGPIVIAGDMDQMKDYSQKILALAQGLNAHFIGYISDKPTLLGLVQEADAFIFPSELEGMSIMLLEAANTDCPIICSDIPANTNMFGEQEVTFFQSKVAEDLAEKLHSVLANPELTKAKAQRAKAKVQTAYSRESMSREYAALYQRILKS